MFITLIEMVGEVVKVAANGIVAEILIIADIN
jgi:hypothetical protein